MHLWALRIFGVITTAGMLIVIIQGALVTQTGSGDACGAEWPLCYGQLIPSNPTIPTLIEYTHRLVSGIMGLMVITHAVWSAVRLKHLRETRLFAVLSVFFIILQSLLGAGAVVWGQSDAIMALHFGFSLISFTSVLLLTLLAFEDGKATRFTTPNISNAMRKYIYFLLIFIYAVVYTGAYVSHTGSGGACGGWPLCNGNLVPSLNTSELIHYFHRFAAGTLFLFMVSLLAVAFKHCKKQLTLYVSILLSTIFITVQVISGAFVIFTGFNLYATMFHAFMISVLFGTFSYTALLANRSGMKK
ncbi:COX15/CtaA family protein [Salisediminibacterium halotolerans]|uniref:COX15/CtaA family protein n=1 Tax=Salisediminibacterium halotolerans TaxID=517425 RepID=UPI0011666CCC|nr:heme A synthase [Salisediminibacterium halotolerans]GEL08615.1 heme A synthase [Salisediminibacterium halotolerans]